MPNALGLGWKLHGDGRAPRPGAVVAPEERLSWPATIGIGAQHVVAMFGATFLVPLLTGFPPATTLFFSGIGTMLFLLLTAGRVPSYLGSSFAFIAPIAAAKQSHGVGGALGGVVMAGVALFLVGLIVQAVGTRWLQILMPPVVTGAIVALIGLNLAPAAKTNFVASPVTALSTLVAIALITVIGRGLIGRLAILLGVSVLLLGPAWCSHLCYIGAWDDRFSRLGPKRPRPLPAWAPRLRAAILAAAVLAPLALRLAGVAWPWALSLAALFGLGGVVVMAVWSRRTGTMVHCSLWCPIGLVNNLAGRVLPWRIKIDAACTACGVCSGACRYNALTLADLRAKRPGLSCSLCGDCLQRCPHGHLDYALAGVTKHARVIFLTLAVTLHTVFLAVARI